MSLGIRSRSGGVGVNRQWLHWAALLVVLAAGIGIRAWAATRWAANMDSDEATFGMMARGILAGQIPTYVYSQYYLGSFESLVAAPFMLLLGQNAIGLRAGAIAIFTAFMLVHFVLVSRIWNKTVGLFSLVFLAIPSMGPFPLTFKPLGHTGLLLASSALLLLCPGNLRFERWASAFLQAQAGRR